MTIRRCALAIAIFCGALVLGAYAQDYGQDPPSRVARLNFISGSVSMQPAGIDEWSPAVINRPFTTGDYLWCDRDGRAELHLNNAAIRLSSTSSIGFLNLDDRIAQIRFSEGEMVVRVRRLGEDESFEVDTPNAAITLLRDGEYRFNADPDSATTIVVVRRGEAEVTGGGQAFSLRAGDSAQLSGTDQLAYNVDYAPVQDFFESWAESRDAREARLVSARYLPPDVIGYEDLDAYGSWRDTPDYGAVWYPSVASGWAPYRDGHWAWVEPWGWTWVDDTPWGFAPFHYGRWAYVGDRWGWIPGPLSIYGRSGGVYERAIYAPALVAFIGGGSWGVSLSIGGPAVGWVPLGPGEVYTPAYSVSQNYFRSVNVTNTTVANNVNITNVYNTVYVNKNVTNVTVNRTYVNMRAPNAVTAVPQNAFASGQPVKRVAVAVQPAQVAQIQNVPVRVAPPVAPTPKAVAPQAGTAPAARPPARVINAPVVAKAPPPPPPVPFAAKQAVLQQNAGRPVNVQAIRQAVPQRAVPPPAVKVAPPAKVVATPPRQAAPAAPATRPPQTMPQPAPSAARPPQPAPRTAQPAPPSQPARPAETYRPPQPQPSQQPARPAETYRPPQPQSQPARPAETYRPPQPAPRPAEPAPRQAQPAPQPPRPSEAQPKPSQQHGVPPDRQQPKPKEKEKSNSEKQQQGR